MSQHAHAVPEKQCFLLLLEQQYCFTLVQIYAQPVWCGGLRLGQPWVSLQQSGWTGWPIERFSSKSTSDKNRASLELLGGEFTHAFTKKDDSSKRTKCMCTKCMQLSHSITLHTLYNMLCYVCSPMKASIFLWRILSILEAARLCFLIILPYSFTNPNQTIH